MVKRSIVDWFAIETKQPPESDALSVLGSSKKAAAAGWRCG